MNLKQVGPRAADSGNSTLFDRIGLAKAGGNDSEMPIRAQVDSALKMKNNARRKKKLKKLKSMKKSKKMGKPGKENNSSRTTKNATQ